MEKLWWENSYEVDIPSIKIVEEETDDKLGNWSGLFNHKGQPLFKEKERIGFKLERVQTKS